MLNEVELNWFNENRESNIHHNVLKKKSNIKDNIVDPLALLGFSISLNKTSPNVSGVKLGKLPTDTETIKTLVDLYNTTDSREYLLLIEIFRYRVIGVELNQKYDDEYSKYKLP